METTIVLVLLRPSLLSRECSSSSRRLTYVENDARLVRKTTIKHITIRNDRLCLERKTRMTLPSQVIKSETIKILTSPILSPQLSALLANLKFVVNDDDDDDNDSNAIA